MAIRFSNYDIRYTLRKKRKIVSWIKEVVKKNNKSIGEITIIFTSDNHILEINKKYLNHNFFTDIITFDYSEENRIEGDIFISIDTVLSNSKKFNSTFDDETLRVIIHGVLHLLGFKDKKREESLEMRSQENTALDLFYSKHDK